MRERGGEGERRRDGEAVGKGGGRERNGVDKQKRIGERGRGKKRNMK